MSARRRQMRLKLKSPIHGRRFLASPPSASNRISFSISGDIPCSPRRWWRSCAAAPISASRFATSTPFPQFANWPRIWRPRRRPSRLPLPTRRRGRLSGARPALVSARFKRRLLVVSWYGLSTPSLIVLPIADDILRDRMSIVAAAVILVLFYLALWPIWIVLGIGAKWLIIGRYKPGVYPLWGCYYLRWWLASGLQRLFDAGGFVGTPLMPIYYRLMGAKVGRRCALDSALVSAWDLVSIGDDTSIGLDTQMHGARVREWLSHYRACRHWQPMFRGLAFGLRPQRADERRHPPRRSVFASGRRDAGGRRTATRIARQGFGGAGARRADLPGLPATSARLRRPFVADRRPGQPDVAGAGVSSSCGFGCWRSGMG